MPTKKKQDEEVIPTTEFQQFFSDLYATEKKEFFQRFQDEGSRKKGTCLEHYNVIKAIGQGAFGKVYLARMSQSEAVVAIKVLTKSKVLKMKQIDHTLSERNVLAATAWPFLVGMIDSFKDVKNLYIVLEFVAGGELFNQLQKMGHFNEALSRFYASQVILGFEYLHAMSLIYRDLKPENILVAADGYIKVTDFGFVKVVEGRTYTMCGTPEYLAPEIIKNKGYGLAVDWWTLGVLIYEMLTGHSPFFRQNQMEMYERILTGEFKMQSSFSSATKDLLTNLLQTNPTKRYGNLRDGIMDIKGHAWFKPLDWVKMYNKEIKPIMKPSCKEPPQASSSLIKIAGSGSRASGTNLDDEFKDF